jgi:NADH-quinone oxidoreductase subunit G
LDADALTAAHEALGEGPVTVVLGRASLAESGAVVAEAATTLAAGLDDTRFLLALRRANVRGALDLGLTPGLLPGRVPLDDGREFFADRWPTVPASTGHDAAGILGAAADGAIDVLVLLGADPLVDFPDRDLARRALDGADTVIALDQFVTESVATADVVLGVAGYAECDGTTTNIEGRVSTLVRRVNPPGTARSDWTVAAELAHRLGVDLGLDSVAAIADEIAAVSFIHAGVFGDTAALEGDGVLVAAGLGAADDGGGRPAPLSSPASVEGLALPATDAYSLRLVSGRCLYDDGTLLAHSPSIASLADPATLRINPADFDKLGIAEGEDVRVTSVQGSITLAVHRDRDVPVGVADVAFNQPGGGGGDLIDSARPVTDIRLETVAH